MRKPFEEIQCFARGDLLYFLDILQFMRVFILLQKTIATIASIVTVYFIVNVGMVSIEEFNLLGFSSLSLGASTLLKSSLGYYFVS